jgi:hypothetical protein
MYHITTQVVNSHRHINYFILQAGGLVITFITWCGSILPPKIAVLSFIHNTDVEIFLNMYICMCQIIRKDTSTILRLQLLKSKYHYN